MPSTSIIDLRSDTVTRPTDAMRRAIAEAVVGDDVFGDDPTVIALEQRVAALLGKEAALFVPSGTQGNLAALLAITSPGDELILERNCHVLNYEVGSVATFGGVQMNAVDGDGGVFTATQVAPLIKTESLHTPRTVAICIENTHNRAGGRVFPLDEIRALRKLADERGLLLHMDGARLWNAHVATGIPLSEYGALCDTMSLCFSKGLGAPMGSIVVSSRAIVERARRIRKRLGGGLRQAGIPAAAALHALDHHIDRLRDDHENARLLAGIVESTTGITPAHTVETNILVCRVDPDAWTVDDLLARLKGRGVLAVPFGAGQIRMVTHLGISSDDIDRVGEAFAAIAPR